MSANRGFEELIAHVKELQRSNPTAKQYWVKFAKEKGDRNMDPRRHSMEFLQEFVDAVESGSVYLHEGINSVSGDGDLVARIKELQRNDPSAKEQWLLFTEVHGGGICDPARHTKQTLETFLAHFNSGRSFAGDGTVEMGGLVKALQKRSTSFKTAWTTYCRYHAGGLNDPLAHDAGFQAQFFESVTQAYNMMADDGTGGYFKGYNDDPTRKMKGMGKGAGGKDSLVEAVKAFQRSGLENKELWSKYADTYLGGKLDPSRHDASALQEFCTSYDINLGGKGAVGGFPGPVLPSGGGGRGSGFRNGWGGSGGMVGGPTRAV